MVTSSMKVIPGLMTWVMSRLPLHQSQGSGQSIARSSNGVDTQDSGFDFVPIFITKSRNVASSGGGDGEVVCDSTMRVVINEFVADPAGSDTDREWIEAYNGAGVDVDISGWELQGGARLVCIHRHHSQWYCLVGRSVSSYRR